MVKPLRYGSVCSGIEAATAAWHPLGWEPAFFSEIEAFPRAVLKHHFPRVPCHGEFTTIKGDEYGPIDWLVGGTPCQDYSIAGLRKGLDGERGQLALEFSRLAYRASVKGFLWENVPGVFSNNGGRDFGAILATFSGRHGSIFEPPKGGWRNSGIVEPHDAQSYGLAWRVFDAQYVRVDGHGRAVPQRRRRVFVVGYIGDWRRAAAVLFDRESLSGNPAPRREAGEGIARDVAPSLVSSGRGVERAGETRGQDPVVAVHCQNVAPTLNAHFGDKQGLEDQHINGGGACSLPPLAMCLNAGAMNRRDAESETLIPVNRCGFDVAHALRAEGFDASEDGTGRGTPLVPICFDSKGTQVQTSETGASPTLRSMSHSNSHQNGGAQFEGPHDTANIRAASGGSSRSYVAQTWAVRRLTPTECERLQGFPDGWTDVPYRGKPAADGPRYKALGNSMAVNVMRRIGRRIEYVEQLIAAEGAK